MTTNVFDRLLNSTCDVQAKGSTPSDTYNQPSQTLSTVVTGVKCRITTMAGGHEYKTGKEYATNRFRVFLRPILLNDLGQAFALTTHHWLLVRPQSGGTILLNLEAVNDPSGLGHHLEAIGLQVIP